MKQIKQNVLEGESLTSTLISGGKTMENSGNEFLQLFVETSPNKLSLWKKTINTSLHKKTNWLKLFLPVV